MTKNNNYWIALEGEYSDDIITSLHEQLESLNPPAVGDVFKLDAWSNSVTITVTEVWVDAHSVMPRTEMWFTLHVIDTFHYYGVGDVAVDSTVDTYVSHPSFAHNWLTVMSNVLSGLYHLLGEEDEDDEKYFQGIYWGDIDTDLTLIGSDLEELT
jgi:hypothetical protein